MKKSIEKAKKNTRNRGYQVSPWASAWILCIPQVPTDITVTRVCKNTRVGFNRLTESKMIGLSVSQAGGFFPSWLNWEWLVHPKSQAHSFVVLCSHIDSRAAYARWRWLWQHKHSKRQSLIRGADNLNMNEGAKERTRASLEPLSQSIFSWGLNFRP